MKYFVECTHTYHSKLNSGIQRVVRNIVRCSQANDNVIPVIFDNGGFVAIEGDIPYPTASAETGSLPGKIRAEVRNQLVGLYRESRALLARLIPFRPFVAFLYAPTSQWGLGRILLLPFRLLKRPGSAPPHAPVRMKTGDVLILLDSSWYLDMWKTIDFHKRNGIRVVTVVYDLIPHSHPQFCTPALAQSFNKWITQAAQRSDAVIAISKTIASDFKRDLPKMTGSARHQPRISHFLLGSELDGAQQAGNAIGPEILRFGQSSRPTYIYVSTIEPRKNHRYALDGFDVLWDRGVEANLVIVGRVGWQGEEFARHVRNHKHFGKRLFMYNNVEDNELAYLYEKVQGLIFTSIAEGFGLPIVEGLQKGLPVFASDIPVFREIGRQGVQFVDISNPASLADTVAAHIAQGAPRLHEPVQWLSWQQSTQQLFTSIETSLVDVWRNDVEEVALEAQSTL